MTEVERPPALQRGADSISQGAHHDDQVQLSGQHRPFQECPCPEASLLRSWLCNPWEPPSREQWPAAVHLAEQIHMGWVRQVSHSISRGYIDDREHWSRASKWPSYAELERKRNTYPNPPRSPEEIREQAVSGWAEFTAGAA